MEYAGKLLKDLKQHKAPGPDLIPNHLLKETAEEIAPVTTDLIVSDLHQAVQSSFRMETCSHISHFQKRVTTHYHQITDPFC